MSEVAINEFASTITDAVKVIDHVWTQVSALKSILDKRLPDALREIGVNASSEGEDESEDSVTDDVTIAWLWRYLLSYRRSEARGRYAHLGRLYVLVRIAPTPNAQDVEPFVPYISIHVDHIKCGECEIDEFDTLLNYREEWGEFESNLFPLATLGRVECYDAKDPSECGAAAFVPLSDIDTDVDAQLVKPIVKLVSHCKGKWFKG